MWILCLNDIRHGRFEDLTPVVRADTKKALELFVDSERCEPYTDCGDRTIIHDTDSIAQDAGRAVPEQIEGYRWSKVFKKGGPLEWYNPPNDSFPCFRHIGTLDENIGAAIARVHEWWNREIMVIPEVGEGRI
jgi:hypothetical protein